MLRYETRDLMTVDRSKYVIAHCISADCAMGKGVVVPIMRKHPTLKKSCKEYSFSRNKDVVGKAYRFEDENGVVYNLFSKYSVRHKAGVGISIQQYHEQLRNCLINMKEQMQQNGEKYLAIPQIACGLDRCRWSDVSKIIEDVFKDSDIEILVCIWG